MNLDIAYGSLVYVNVPVSVTPVVDITTDVVEIAIVPARVDIQNSDWKTAAWKPGAAIPTARLLVGFGRSGGALTIADKGVYSVTIRPQDSPEVPVLPSGWITVT